MKVLVCGDRDWKDINLIMEAVENLGEVVIIHGNARGADRLAGAVARTLGLPEVIVPAQWPYYGKSAGPIRNRWMLDLEPDLVVAFHDCIEESKGTKDCVNEAKRRGIPTEIFTHEVRKSA